MCRNNDNIIHRCHCCPDWNLARLAAKSSSCFASNSSSVNPDCSNFETFFSRSWHIKDEVWYLTKRNRYKPFAVVYDPWEHFQLLVQMLWNPDARRHMREYLTTALARTHCKSSDYVFRSNGFLILLFAYFICLRGYQMDEFYNEFGQCSRWSQWKWIRVHLHNILSPNHAFLWHTRHRWVIVLHEKKMSDDGLKGGENLHTSDHLGNSSLWQRKVFIRWCSVARMTFSVGHVGIKGRNDYLLNCWFEVRTCYSLFFLNWPLCLPCVFFLYATEDPFDRLYRSILSTQSHFCRSWLENLSMFVWSGDWNTRVFLLAQMGIWISRFSFRSLFWGTSLKDFI